jgi:hypothetical protein
MKNFDPLYCETSLSEWKLMSPAIRYIEYYFINLDNFEQRYRQARGRLLVNSSPARKSSGSKLGVPELLCITICENRLSHIYLKKFYD